MSDRKNILNAPSCSLVRFLEENAQVMDPVLVEALGELMKSRTELTTCEEVILLNKTDIQRSTGLSSEGVNLLLAYLSNVLLYRLYVLPPNEEESDDLISLMSAREIENLPISSIRLSTGSRLLDRRLGGGILPSGITEIAGESGCGKTQICLQLCLQAQLPFASGGLEGGVLYLATETDPPLKRLRQLIEARKLGAVGRALQDNIFIERVTSATQLINLLSVKLSVVISQRTIRLLIIDSVAALFRSEYGPDMNDVIEKTNLLWELTNQLKLISDQHGITVVVTNQATDHFEPLPQTNNNNNSNQIVAKSSGGMDLQSLIPTSRPSKKRKSTFIPPYQSSRQLNSTFLTTSSNNKSVVPALGLPWANFINTRIMLTKQPPGATYQVPGSSTSLPIRLLDVVLSSHLPSGNPIGYCIDTSGLFVLDDDEKDDFSLCK
eukprot:gene7861-9226_t